MIRKADSTPDPAYLTTREVAKRLRVATHSVVAYICSGQLKAICTSIDPNCRSRRYRVRPADLEAFETARAVQPPPPKRRRQSRKYKRYV